MRRFSPSGLIVFAAAMAALLLTVVRPSPEGLIRFSLGEREVRAAPGEVVRVQAKHDLTALDVFNVTLVRIRDAYVDPSRIDPKKMLYEALDSVQFNIPEVLVEAYPDRDEVVVVVNDKKQTFSTKEVDSPWRLSAKLKKIFRFIESHMNPGADLAQVEYAAVNGMLNTLDPHSLLLDPETAREMDVSTSGKFGGLGIVIRIYKRKLTIVRPMKGTPADRAGLRSGDHIVQINDEVTEHLTLQESVERMRGEPNTPVTLWIKREGMSSPMKVELQRAIIRIESVQSRMLSGNVGYLRITQFSGRTDVELKDAMDELRGKGAKGWILDLRSNPGGLLEQAIKVADLFVESGTIVTTVGGHEREPRRAGRKGTDHLPVAVLVNEHSASASEIVAGALKNLDRGIIVGSNTFGKGSVQVLYDNKDGSKLKLTIAQYLTPGDRSIQSLGIVPDIELHRMYVPDNNDEPTDFLRLLEPTHTYREKDLESHLTSRYATDLEEKPMYEVSFLYESKKDKQVFEEEASSEEEGASLEGYDEGDLDDEFVEDFEIKLTRDLVAQSTTATRSAMIAAAKSLVARHRAEQHQKLTQALKTLGVDWTEPPATREAAPQLDARVTADRERYDAGEIVKLTGTVTNHGTGPAYQVHTRVRSDNGSFEDAELVFGRIGPGETRTWTTMIKLPKDSRDRVDELTFEFKEARGAKAMAMPVAMRIVAAARPVFAYSHQLIDHGNGDGLVQKGEEHRLRVTIKNTGKGVAAQPTAVLRNASGDGVVLKKARFELDALKPGESKVLDFVFDVTRELEGEEAVVEMTVYDQALHESVVEKLKYKVRGAAAGPASTSGWIKVATDTPIYEGAAEDSVAIATAPKGSGFKVTGKQGSWVRIELEPGRPGFVAAAHARQAGSKPSNAAIQPRWQVTPPTIAVSIPSYTTNGGTYRLSGKVTDDTHVEDVYIFVSNFADKVENKKVFYKSNRKGKTGTALDFATEIPLWPGTNRVTIVARENDEVRSSHTMYVLRQNNSKTAAK